MFGLFAPKRVILRDTRDEDGTRYLDARLEPNGDLIIEGQDLGDGVERFFGPGEREYEWTWTVKAADVPKLKRALGGGHVLKALKRRFSGSAARDLKPFLVAHAIPHEVWPRTGD